MFQRLPNTGPFGDDTLDTLRSEALGALSEKSGRLPPAVVDYFQEVEGRLINATFKRKAEFLRTSWDQFRPAVPSELDNAKAAINRLTAALGRAHDEIVQLQAAAEPVPEADALLDLALKQRGAPCDGEVRGCYRCGGDPGKGNGCDTCAGRGWLLWNGSPGQMSSKPVPEGMEVPC